MDFASRFPEDVQVFLIEAADLSLGLEMSEPVERAMRTVSARLEQRIAGYRGPA